MTSTDDRLDTNAILVLIQPMFEQVISRSRTLDPMAGGMATLSRSHQDRVLHWIEVIARTNAELAFQFASHAPDALEKLSITEFEAWVLHAMHVYDHHGLHAATNELVEIHRFILQANLRRQRIGIDEVSTILETFVHGLNGRRLAIETAEPTTGCWTDTETIYLPASIDYFDSRERNFQIYKSMATMLWAQTWFGTFELDQDRELKLKSLTDYPDVDLARSVFLALESHRLLARIALELPGLGRQMRELTTGQALSVAWRQAVHGLDEHSTVDDCLSRVTALLDQPLPEPFCFQPDLRLPVTEHIIQTRTELQRQQLKQALDKLVPPEARRPGGNTGESTETEPDPEDMEFKMLPTPGGGNTDFELSFMGNRITPSPEVQKLLQAILQDLGEIPLDFLVAGGSADPGRPMPSPVELAQSSDDEPGGLPYPEWDYRRGHYRQDWCYLRELEVDDGPGDFVDVTLKKYATVLPQLRKSFEALRGEDRWLRRQLDGDEVDIDALVDALADMHSGEELSDRLYTRLSRIDRNIAVVLMIDMSGSTKGWINDAERESLVLLCEALEILGDQYAIFGFSGMTRKRCELYRIKRFDEPYSDAVERRIGGIGAKDYTRMGVTIRHLNKLLETVSARTKLLITLSDGKPEDFDGYGGDYGIEDTRQALIESRRLGIHPFCITIDTEASSYLPHMYGANGYAVVDDVRTLPLRVADVYRRLTH